MEIKEIITYIMCTLGIGLVCYAKILFMQRQNFNKDSEYTTNEKIVLRFGYLFTAIAIFSAIFIIY